MSINPKGKLIIVSAAIMIPASLLLTSVALYGVPVIEDRLSIEIDRIWVAAIGVGLLIVVGRIFMSRYAALDAHDHSGGEGRM